VTSPGLVLRGLILRDEVFGAGLCEYDFLDGAEAYKARWTTRVRRLFDVEVYRPGLRGRLRCALRGGPRMLRDLLRPERYRAGAPFDEVSE
jgi:CelD/BcsL family acetyltransferase involved in cellulose biosynthesis